MDYFKKKKNHIFIQNDTEQLIIKYLIVIIDYKDYITNDFLFIKYSPRKVERSQVQIPTEIIFFTIKVSYWRDYTRS